MYTDPSFTSQTCTLSSSKMIVSSSMHYSILHFALHANRYFNFVRVLISFTHKYTNEKVKLELQNPKWVEYGKRIVIIGDSEPLLGEVDLLIYNGKYYKATGRIKFKERTWIDIDDIEEYKPKREWA